ncbi:MAG: 16S rRNA (adenine(1518)-N(6)/adenine(1519)-N(6))-dimethyltransferase RsmA [Actinomycetota bacterium]|nr:16S rRNA (adenine(1518)-N(6)/adenine(1519)-N(6))-dimethyltransferase RsmA [Actinomycetota bacterium]
MTAAQPGPPGRREARELLDSNGLSPNRSLGQHFVVDPNTVRRIARLAAVGPGDSVIEVGAGLGALTLALAETGASVTAVEIDRGIVPVLRRIVEPAGVTVVEGDAMALDWDSLLDTSPRSEGRRGPGPWVLVANLPYNVATPLIVDLLRDVAAITRMLVMVQREAGERLVAGPGDRGYGAVSVRVAYWAEAAVVGRVPASVFLPRPEVESVLVELRRRVEPAVGPDVDRSRLFALVAAGFGQRRKMLRRSLAGMVDADAFVRADVRPEARAEELDLAAWGRLAGSPPLPQ